MFASHVFPDKNQKPLRMCRMRITKQVLPILSLISGNVLLNLDLDYWKRNSVKISSFYFLLSLIDTNFLPFFDVFNNFYITWKNVATFLNKYIKKMPTFFCLVAPMRKADKNVLFYQFGFPDRLPWKWQLLNLIYNPCWFLGAKIRCYICRDV